ncbi:hypothetical protein SOVF_146530 [Spinacia oleracea]|uniref:Uncharacterized RING finger protein C57A7.09-like n=1 Tax=Spinacia oleracea TaxID=3562 RepID=A0A9R0JEZ8_SPIOL|nr:uncharacterized RING finger protein C57A7.09-like [Spinacia oleracea]KNA10208.1 hypothetical protein SOVF_146530 [Spinacia oleracea]
MAVVLIPCPHNRDNNTLLPKLEVQLIHHMFERLIFHQVNGLDLDLDEPLITEYRQSGHGTITRTYNPYCRNCHHEIVDYFISLGYSYDRILQLLQSQRKKVERKCGELESGKIDNCRVLVLPPLIAVTRRSRVLRHYDEVVLTAWRERESLEEYEAARRRRRSTPASKESIEALKRSIIQGNEDTICVICLEEFKNNKTEGPLIKKTMPCKHEFHEACIDQWLHNARFCPICRFHLPAADA